MAQHGATDPSEVPEADKLEQSVDVGDVTTNEPGVTPLEANEADAAEQHIAVPDDEDYPRE